MNGSSPRKPPTGSPCRSIHLIEADAWVRAALAEELALHEGLSVRSYASAAEFLNVVKSDSEGCALLGSLPGEDAFSILEVVRETAPYLGTVILVGYGDVAGAVRAMKLGAVAAVERPLTTEMLSPILRDALAWSMRTAADARRRDSALARVARLDSQDEQVLQLAIQGHTNEEIAEQLGVSLRTVERRRSSGLDDLGVGSLIEAAEAFRTVESLRRELPQHAT